MDGSWCLPQTEIRFGASTKHTPADADHVRSWESPDQRRSVTAGRCSQTVNYGNYGTVCGLHKPALPLDCVQCNKYSLTRTRTQEKRTKLAGRTSLWILLLLLSLLLYIVASEHGVSFWAAPSDITSRLRLHRTRLATGDPSAFQPIHSVCIACHALILLLLIRLPYILRVLLIQFCCPRCCIRHHVLSPSIHELATLGPPEKASISRPCFILLDFLGIYSPCNGELGYRSMERRTCHTGCS